MLAEVSSYAALSMLNGISRTKEALISAFAEYFLLARLCKPLEKGIPLLAALSHGMYAVDCSTS